MRKLGKLWLWIVYAFLFLPIFVVIAYSFNAAKYTSAWKGFTLKWYSQLFGNAALIDAVVNTLSVAALAASLFHFGELTVDEVKEHLRQHNIPVRTSARA